MRIPKLEQWALVEIEWLDSAGTSSGWHKPTKKEMEIDGCVTVGMLYAQSRDRLVVVLSRDTQNNNIDGIVTIPTVAITGITTLRRTT